MKVYRKLTAIAIAVALSLSIALPKRAEAACNDYNRPGGYIQVQTYPNRWAQITVASGWDYDYNGPVWLQMYVGGKWVASAQSYMNGIWVAPGQSALLSVGNYDSCGNLKAYYRTVQYQN